MHKPIASLLLTAAFLLGAASPAATEARKLITEKKYDEAIAKLEPAHKAKPADADVTKMLAEANLAKAEGMMYDDAMPPRQKYPGALRAYREVLKYDKTNKKAQDQIKTIQDIYKSMGRPVPQ